MPMDLSKLSDDDLAALQKGDLKSVSDDGLAALQSGQVPANISFPGSKYLLNSAIGKSLAGGTESALEATPATAAGAAEGATFGGATHLAAGAMSAADLAKQAASGDVPNMLGAPAKWREYQQMLKKKEKALQEESPLGYGIGEGLGMAAATPLIPELGGAKAIAAAGKASPALDLFLAGKAGGGLAKMAGKGAAGAIEGAPLGAVIGATGSDASTPEDFASDVASGAGMGSLGGLAVGGAVQGAKSLLGGVSGELGKRDAGRQLIEAFNYKKPLGLSTTETDMALKPGQYSEDLVNRVNDVRSELGQDINDSLDLATVKGTKVNVDKNLNQISQDIFDQFNTDPALIQALDPKTQKILLQLGKGGFGNLTPNEAHSLKNQFFNLSNSLSNSNSPLAYDTIKYGNNAGQAIDAELKKQVPKYKQASDAWQEFHSGVPETIISKGKPEDINPIFYGDLKNPDSNLYDSTKSMIKSGMLGGTEAGESRATLEKLRQNLLSLQKTQPQALDILTGGQPVEDYTTNLQHQADQLAMFRQSAGKEPGVEPDILTKGYQALGKLLTGSKAPTIGIANQLGRITDIASQTPPVRIASGIFNADNGKLMQVAQKLKNTTGGQFYGQALEKALSDKSDFGKNAVLFKLLQIPEYREMLKSDGFDNSAGSQ